MAEVISELTGDAIPRTEDLRGLHCPGPIRIGVPRGGFRATPVSRGSNTKDAGETDCHSLLLCSVSASCHSWVDRVMRR